MLLQKSKCFPRTLIKGLLVGMLLTGTVSADAKAAVDINRIGGVDCFAMTQHGTQLFNGFGSNYYSFTTRKILLDMIAIINRNGFNVVESYNPVPGVDAYCYFYAY